MSEIKEKTGKALTFLWMFLTSSIFVYGLVGYVVSQSNQETERLSDTTLNTLIVITIMIAVIALIIVPKIIKPKEDSHLFGYCLIQWALIESIAIFGLMSYYLGGPFSVFISMLGASVILMVLLLPTSARLKKLLETDII